jgi:hypothetical protein
MVQEIREALDAARRKGFDAKDPALVTFNGVRLDFKALTGIAFCRKSPQP